MIKLTQHHIPEAKAFNLLGDDEETKVKPDATMDNSTDQGKLTRHCFAITSGYKVYPFDNIKSFSIIF